VSSLLKSTLRPGWRLGAVTVSTLLSVTKSKCGGPRLWTGSVAHELSCWSSVGGNESMAVLCRTPWPVTFSCWRGGGEELMLARLQYFGRFIQISRIRAAQAGQRRAAQVVPALEKTAPCRIGGWRGGVGLCDHPQPHPPAPSAIVNRTRAKLFCCGEQQCIEDIEGHADAFDYPTRKPVPFCLTTDLQTSCEQRPPSTDHADIRCSC